MADDRRQADLMWPGLLLPAADEIRKALPMDEASYQLIAGAAHADGRAYFLYSVADELLAAAGALFGWFDLLEDMRKPGQETDRFWLESIADEQSFRTRKLVEILIALICFRQTNEPVYFRHHALINRLNDVRGTQNDLTEFFACPSENVAAQVDALTREIAEVEAGDNFDMAAAWYAVGQTPRTASQLAAIGPGRLATSARNRLKTALQTAPIDEKIALGLSYGRLYSQVSRSIHFTPSSKDTLDVEAISRGSGTCGLVALRVVAAVQILLDDVPGDSNRRIRELLDSTDFADKLGVSLTMGRAEIGDFVLAYGDLAEVIDTTTSSYGYRSYKVHYLDGSPMPEIQEDWFPAQTVRVLFSRETLRERAQQAVDSGQIPQEIVDKMSASDATHFRESVVALWHAGLREFVLRPSPSS